MSTTGANIGQAEANTIDYPKTILLVGQYTNLNVGSSDKEIVGTVARKQTIYEIEPTVGDVEYFFNNRYTSVTFVPVYGGIVNGDFYAGVLEFALTIIPSKYILNDNEYAISPTAPLVNNGSNQHMFVQRRIKLDYVTIDAGPEEVFFKKIKLGVLNCEIMQPALRDSVIAQSPVFKILQGPTGGGCYT